ncbi:sporulation initiation factor Spo0A C-terminal domain-containing protein [Ruminococcus sp.]|uniref:sporulation initiation factor Spo0A C-terminal domain-containing protein n=1 Tax=Ruminococcus sp. TaxID=41978 RepID=UPI0025F4FEA1|nr:sporulation initiation factor Spo0A C-terminal domain-containing protein [Ruminococcus sp.]
MNNPNILVGSLSTNATNVTNYLKICGYNTCQVDRSPLTIQLEVIKSNPDILIMAEMTQYPYELCENLKSVDHDLRIIMLAEKDSPVSGDVKANYVDKIIKSPMSCEDIKSAVIEVSQIKVRANEPDINIKRICDETELSAQQIHNDITQALKLLCITPNYTGYEYIREAVKIVLEGDKLTKGMSKIIYPTVAQRHDVTPASVERSIRTAIKRCWQKVEEQNKVKFFGNFALDPEFVPTNSELVFVIADRISCKCLSGEDNCEITI